MNNKILLVLLILLLPALAQEAIDSKGTLAVFLEGFGNDEGTARIALCNSRENYEAADHAYRSVIAGISDGHSAALFDSLQSGEYAVKVFHDENENGELDTNFLGVPGEAYGFSNNVRGTFGPADWDDAKFYFSVPHDTITIRLK